MIQTMGVLLGGSWASGVNVYLSIAALGIAQRMQWLSLPGEMGVFSHPLIIGAALLLYGINFIADKVPYFDSLWDSIHTIIRPAGGAIIGFLAMAETGPAVQYAVALLTGTVALDAHLTKATTRAVINTSPEPVSNSIASVTEDAMVLGVMYLIIRHPIIATLVVIAFIAFSVWFLKKMFSFLKRVFSPRSHAKPTVAAAYEGYGAINEPNQRNV